MHLCQGNLFKSPLFLKVSCHKGLNQPMWYEMLKKGKRLLNGLFMCENTGAYTTYTYLCVCVCVCAHHTPSHKKKNICDAHQRVCPMMFWVSSLIHCAGPPHDENRPPPWGKWRARSLLLLLVLAVMTVVSDSRDDATPSWLGISSSSTVAWGHSRDITWCKVQASRNRTDYRCVLPHLQYSSVSQKVLISRRA